MNHQIQATAVVTAEARLRYPDDVRKIMRARLADEVANEIAKVFTPSSRVSDFGFGDITHTLDLVVFSRDEWEKFCDSLRKKGQL